MKPILPLLALTMLTACQSGQKSESAAQNDPAAPSPIYSLTEASGELLNGARLDTLSTEAGTEVILNLGDQDGYYDMGTKMGEIIKNLNDFTLSVSYKVDASNELDGYGHFLFACSALAENSADEGPYVAFRLNEQRFETSTGGYAHEEIIMQGGKPERDTWHHALYRQQGHKGEFYLDGELIGTNENMPILSEIFAEAPANCWIGRAPFKGDKYLSKTEVKDLFVYDCAIESIK